MEDFGINVFCCQLIKLKFWDVLISAPKYKLYLLNCHLDGMFQQQLVSLSKYKMKNIDDLIAAVKNVPFAKMSL